MRRLRASSRGGGGVMTRQPSPLTMFFSRHTRRREFIALLGGAAGLAARGAAGWPLAARAQQPDRMRRIGVLIGVAGDPETKAWVASFRKRLDQTGLEDRR
jgi:putative ABC transport system substrate-binding protein